MSFIFKITTTTSPQAFVIPCVALGAFNATVDYGDGTGSQTVTAYNDANLTHSFATAGQHTITIDGTFPNVRFYDNAACRVLVNEVVDLGDVGWTNLGYAFGNCTNLTAFNVGTADTSNVTNMARTFLNCSSLTSLGLSSFDTSSVNGMSHMFFGCASLTSLGLSSFDTSSVNNMSVMFGNCLNLTSLGLGSFDTSSVTNIQSMFANCLGLTSLNIKHFDVSNVTNGTNFLLNANNALTTTAYDELLEAWAAQDVQPNVAWHFGDAQYTVETIADWYSPRSNSSLSIINNKLVSIADSTGVFGAAQQIDNLIVGNSYKIIGTATCSNSSVEVFIRVSDSLTITNVPFSVNATGSVTANDSFIATATTLYVGTLVSGTANDTVTLDAGITVKEITNYTEANAASEIEYSQENVFGSEEVVNGDFATDLSGWSVTNPTGVTVEWTSNGMRILTDGTGGGASQSILEIGKTYLIEFDYTAVSGSLKLDAIINTLDTTKKYSIVKTATQIPLTFYRQSGTAEGIIDNVSVKEITNAVEYKNIPQSARELYTLEDAVWVNNNELIVNGDFSSSGGWTQGSSWNIGGGNATCTGAYSLLTTAVGDTFNSSYKVKYTIESWSGGSIKMSVGGYDQTTSQTNNGTYTEIYNVSNPSSNTTFYVIPTSAVLSVDNISVKRAIEVVDFVEPVTSGMTLTTAWMAVGTAYYTLGEALSGSVRVDATISNTDSGIIMESGGTTLGLVLYVYSGVLYFQCGSGTAFGTSADRAEVSYTLPVGEFDYIIEWSADLTNAVLYVNGLRVGSQTFIASRISGSNSGTIGRISDAAALNRGGWSANAAGVYTNTITKCDVFLSQVTSDV